MKKWLYFLSIYILFINTSACSFTNENSATHPETTSLTVAAASDLQFAFTELAKKFENASNCHVDLVFNSSGTLTRQIEQGAPYDIFASANIEFVDNLRKKGKTIPNTQKLYATGEIGMVSLLNKSSHPTKLHDLLNPEIKKIAIANPEHAPYGLAAKQALESSGLWDKLQNKLVYGKSVADTLTLVTSGNAETGIVAHSIITEDMQYSGIDEQLHEPINQAITVVAGTDNKDLAIEFIQYVISNEGQSILRKYGFNSPDAVK